MIMSLPVLREQFAFEPLQFLTDRCAQPSRRTKDRERAIEKKSDVAQAGQASSRCSKHEQMNKKQPFPNLHHQPKSFAVAPRIVVETLVNA